MKTSSWFSRLCFFIFACAMVLAVVPVLAQQNNINRSFIQTSPAPTDTPEVTATPEAQLEFGANWYETENRNKKDYQLLFDWTSLPNVRGYSLMISKEPGASPQKKLTTVRTEYTFKTVTPGEWYVNLIAQKKNKEWTEVYYWKVQVGPLPTPTPEAVDEEEVQSIKTRVQNMIKNFTRQSEEEAEEEQEETVLGEDDTINQLLLDRTKKKSRGCNCDVSCSQVRSCQEVYRLFYQCQCTNLDGNDDGIPCNNQCGGQ